MNKTDLAIPKVILDKRVLDKPFLAKSITKEKISPYFQELPDLANEACAIEAVLEVIDKNPETKNSEENPPC